MKKKIITVVVILGILGLCIAGGNAAIHYKKDSAVVKVVPVSLINSGYWGDQMSSYGTVTNDYYQEVELNDKELPEKIYVSVGDKVKVGDKLFRYDTTLVDLDLKLKQHEIAAIEKKIASKEAEIAKLRTVTPVAEHIEDDWGDDWEDDWDDEWDDSDDTDDTDDTEIGIPDEIMRKDAYCYLDETAEPYRGNGSKKNPYRFICTEDAVLSGGFLNTVAGFDADGEEMIGEPQIIVLEVHKGNKKKGDTLVSWMIDGTNQTEMEKDSLMKMSFLIQQKDKDKKKGEDNSEEEEIDTSDETGEEWEGDQTEENYEEEPEEEETGGSVLDGFDYGEDAAKFLQYDSLYDPEQTYTKQELDDMIVEDTEDIEELKLEKKEVKIEIRKLKNDRKEATVYSEVEGIVRSIDQSQLEDEEAEGSSSLDEGLEGEEDFSDWEEVDDYEDDSYGDDSYGEASDPFMVISGAKGLYIKGTLNEFMLEDVGVGQTIYANSWDTGASVEAKIEKISEYPSMDNSFSDEQNSNVSYYPFVAYVDEESGLSNGETVEISMVVGGSEDSGDEDGIYLSKAFIRNDEGGYYVYKRGNDNKLVKTYVKTGKVVFGNSYEITQGVTQNDWLAFPYGKEVKEGVKTEEDEDGASLEY